MSFQAYPDNIQARAGKSAADFRQPTAKQGYTEKGQLRAGVKAADIGAWMEQDFDLGHGHAMAIVALLKGTKSESDKQGDAIGQQASITPCEAGPRSFPR